MTFDLSNLSEANQREMGESIAYWPQGVEDDARAITAIVSRDADSVLPYATDAFRPSLVIRVRNDAASGVTSAELDQGKDKFSLPARVGKTAEPMSPRLLGHDANDLLIGLR